MVNDEVEAEAMNDCWDAPQFLACELTHAFAPITLRCTVNDSHGITADVHHGRMFSNP